MKLRDYQDYAVVKIMEALLKDDCAEIVAAPTGVGKTLIISGAIKKIFDTWPNYPHRVLVLTHVKELIEQNYTKLKAYWPTASAGVYSSGLKRKELNLPITFAGIQSIFRMAEEVGRSDILFIDECHLISDKGSTMYASFIRALKILNPKMRIIGLTATPFRMGLGLLTEGELFNGICCNMTSLEAFNWFIDQGYLCPLMPFLTNTKYDLDKIRVTAGDYNMQDLDHAMNISAKNIQAVDEIIAKGQDRSHWLIFGVSVNHVESLAKLFNERGIKTTFVHSKMKDAERDQRIADYKAGIYQCMVNNGILTTGFDFPSIDLVAIIRKIMSPGLWGQMLGRGTRPDYMDGFDLETQEGRLAAIHHSEKQNCLVLDFGGNTLRLGPINDLVLPRKKGNKGGGKAPARACITEGCNAVMHPSVYICPNCGAEYDKPLDGDNILTKSSKEELIRKERKPKQIAEPKPVVEEWHKVTSVFYSFNSGKNGKPDSVRVDFRCGLRVFSEYLCFNHSDFPRAKARATWRNRVAFTEYANEEPPATVLEALNRTDELRIPSKILVRETGRFPQIVDFGFDEILVN